MKKQLTNVIVRMGLAAVIAVSGLVTASPMVQAAGDYEKPMKIDWQHHGFFGTFDQASLQRGFQVYRQVCAACHGMDLIAYRNLMDLGYTDAQVRAIAAEATVQDGPNDEGDMFDRPGIPADRFVNPYANEKAARYANNGAYPPDLSLIVRARHYNEDYIYSLLAGYTEAPADFQLSDGMHYNPYFPGKQIAMAAPLSAGVVAYEDGTEASVEQMSKDVTNFLAWASDPHQIERKQMGFKVVLFLLFLTVIVYKSKKKVWKDLE